MRDSDPAVHIRERGVDFAVYQRVTSTTNGNDIVSSTTNEFTLLEDGLHYLEAGEWKTSEDLIESFPGGAVARRGPNKDGTHEPLANPPNPADRSGIAYYKITLGSTPAIDTSNSGRVYDATPSTTNQKFYYTPSLAVNKNGDMILGFSGSSATDYISAYYTGRLGTGEMLAVPRRYFDGKDAHYTDPLNQATFKWGDYSYSCLDPDGLTLWSIQAYSETTSGMTGPRAWGTRIVGTSTR